MALTSAEWAVSAKLVHLDRDVRPRVEWVQCGCHPCVHWSRWVAIRPGSLVLDRLAAHSNRYNLDQRIGLDYW